MNEGGRREAAASRANELVGSTVLDAIDAAIHSGTARNVAKAREAVVGHVSPPAMQAICDWMYETELVLPFALRLNTAYIYSDMLHHAVKAENSSAEAEMLRANALKLLRAAFHAPGADREKVTHLIDIWQRDGCVTAPHAQALRVGVKVPLPPSRSEQPANDTKQHKDNVARAMNDTSQPTQDSFGPAKLHGQAGAQYWELPAACMLPAAAMAPIPTQAVRPCPLPQAVPLALEYRIDKLLADFDGGAKLPGWEFPERSPPASPHALSYEGWPVHSGSRGNSDDEPDDAVGFSR